MSPPELPTVLMLRPPPTYNHFQSQFSTNFNFIKAYENPLPLPDFLATSPAALSATAMLVSPTGGPITSDTLRLLPSLRCIVTSSAGVNHIDLVECRRRNISVAAAGDRFSDDTADMAVALVIDAMRRISASDRFVRGGSWNAPVGDVEVPGSTLRGKRVGILGLGKIGSKIAKRLSAFGCSILYTSRSRKDWVPYEYYKEIREMATESDILVVSCMLTEETKHMVDGRVLEALGREGVLVNVARGEVVHQDELIASLAQGRIAAAALDVFENEPFVPHELRAMENVVLTPHMAVCTVESFRVVNDCVTANLKAFFSGQPLITPVVL